jgi:DNA-binding IclR family transcriptional regulator
MTTPPSTKNDLIGSVSRAITILDVLSTRPQGLTVKAISLETGLNLSTCYHLINTLVAHQMLAQGPAARTFVLGPKISAFHMAFANHHRPPADLS